MSAPLKYVPCIWNHHNFTVLCPSNEKVFNYLYKYHKYITHLPLVYVYTIICDCQSLNVVIDLVKWLVISKSLVKGELFRVAARVLRGLIFFFLCVCIWCSAFAKNVIFRLYCCAPTYTTKGNWLPELYLACTICRQLFVLHLFHSIQILPLPDVLCLLHNLFDFMYIMIFDIM